MVLPIRPSVLVLLTLLSGQVGCAQGGAGADVAEEDASAPDGAPSDTPPASGLLVYDVSPSVGPVAGGVQVTLSGDGFAEGLAVSFGGAAATLVSLQVPSTAVVLAPPSPTGQPGRVDLALQNPGDAAPYVVPQAFRYAVVDAPGVSWCRLVFPPELTAAVALPSTAVLGRVRVDGLTEAEGAAAGVMAQVGYGPLGTLPDDPVWAWEDASFHGDADSWFPGDRAADEYAGRLHVAATGTFAFTVRFSADGATWAACDLDGGEVQADALGRAKVVASLLPGVVWAQLVGPEAILADKNAVAAPSVGRVVATGQGGDAPPLVAQFGWGPRGTLPTDAGWSWLSGTLRGPAEPGPGVPDDAIDYEAVPPTSDEGVWSTAWRFSADEGAAWTYGDLDGSDNEPSLAGLGLLRVGRRVEACRFDAVGSLTVALGDSSAVLAGVVTASSLTDQPGPALGILGQVGWGPPGSDPRTDAGWKWQNASYQSDTGDLSSDVYGAVLQPSAEGDAALAYRFSADGGSQWLHCDRTGSVDGFSPELLPTLHVVAPSPTTVAWCRFVGPLAMQVKVSNPSAPLVAHVQVDGRTQGEGPGFGVQGALGLRPVAADDWTWIDAEYAGDANGPGGSPLSVDVYRAVAVPPAVGAWQTVFRFTADGGATWTLCDSDGSDDGFEPTALGALTVFADADAALEQAVLDPPLQVASVAGWHSSLLRARARVPGYTDAPEPLGALSAQVGFGPTGSTPDASGWSWSAAAFDADADVPAGFHAYAGTVETPDVGTYAFAARFSLGGAPWVPADADGSSNGWFGGSAGTLTVVPPALGSSVGWCAIEALPQVTVSVGEASPVLRAEVFVPGVTSAQGWGAGVIAQVGLSSVAYGGLEAFDAAWASDSGSNDAYEGVVRPSAAGDYVALFRFSTDGGATWTWCDTDGLPYDATAGLPVQVVP